MPFPRPKCPHRYVRRATPRPKCHSRQSFSRGSDTDVGSSFQIVSAAVTLPSKMRKRKTNLGRQGGANLRHPSPTSTAPCPKSVWIHVQLPAAYKLPSRGSRRVTGWFSSWQPRVQANRTITKHPRAIRPLLVMISFFNISSFPYIG